MERRSSSTHLDGEGTDGRALDVKPIVLALLVVAAVWIALFIVRVQARQPNTDDYFYAIASLRLVHASSPLSAILTTGQTSPLVPTLAAPLVAAWGVDGGIAVNLPILLILSLGAYTLARVWSDKSTSLVVLLLTGLNAAVLSYALMFNFALASTTAMVWCLATYMRSNRLHRWGWSLGFAFSIAALVLSRSIAPVYAAPLLMLVVVDLGWRLVKREQKIAMAAPAVIGIVLILAGPWWLRSGGTVTHYLLHAGYQPSSGDTTGGLVPTTTIVWNRVTLELFNLDWIGGVLLGVAVAAAIVAWWFMLRNRQRFPGLWILWVWTIIALLILSSSGNAGTAFGLPLVTVVIIACGVVLGRVITRHRVVIAGSVLGLMAFTSASLFSYSLSPWWHAPPYRYAVLSVGGSRHADLLALTQAIDDSIRGEKTVIGVQDPLVNTNGLLWSTGSQRLRSWTGWLVSPSGPNPTADAIDHLKSAKWLVTGNGSYGFVPLDQDSIQSAAFRRGFRPVRTWNLGPSANVVLWRKGARTTGRPGVQSVVRLIRPTNGSSVGRNVILLCVAQGPVGIASVDFEVAGGPAAMRQSFSAGMAPFGWIGIWPAQRASPGQYTITCNATDYYGATGHTSISVDVP